MRFALYSIAFLALQAGSTFAQNAMPTCDGDITIVRVFQIKTGGSMAGFMAAVAAQKAWYKANGVTDNEIQASRVLVKDTAAGGMKYSDTEVLTYHVHPPSEERTPEIGDSDWNAFEKQYKDNADLKSEYTTCMPKLSR
jgi:hypothetical protein